MTLKFHLNLLPNISQFTNKTIIKVVYLKKKPLILNNLMLMLGTAGETKINMKVFITKNI